VVPAPAQPDHPRSRGGWFAHFARTAASLKRAEKFVDKLVDRLPRNAFKGISEAALGTARGSKANGPIECCPRPPEEMRVLS
jgi:hypothetical protein